MPFIKSTLFQFGFKREPYTAAFFKAIQLVMRNAAREFAKAVLIRVPVQTGFARGSLLNLADAIGLSASSSPESFRRKLDKRRMKVYNVPLNGKVSYYTDSGGKVPKTPENARQFSTAPDKVFTQEDGVFIFNYAASILYYVINDASANPYTPSSPWLSFAAGHMAFINYLHENLLDDVPAISDYIEKTEIRNG